VSKLDIPSVESIDFQLKTLELEEDFFEFVLWVFKVIYKRPFLTNWHHRTLAQIMMDIHSGKLHHTIITMPPRYTKTEEVVKLWPAWCFAKNSKCNFLHLAYSDVLAADNSSAVKSIITSIEFQQRWPIELRKDTTAKKKWKTESDGEFSATAAGGAVTGFGAGILGSKSFAGALIIDDPLKPDEAKSDLARKNVNDRFPETIKSRLNDRTTPLILIMQRLHEDDPVGFLLGGGTEFIFTHINLPALNEDGPSEYDPREVGEPLWPDKHTAEELELMRISNAMTFAGQYQQRPAPKEGNIFKKFKYYKALPDDSYFKIHSWDMTFKAKSKSKKGKVDFVVGTEWGKRRSTKDIYLMPDMVRARMGYSDTEIAVKAFIARHPDFKALLIEDKANGSAIIDRLKKAKVKRIKEIEPTGDKEERAEAVAPLFDSGDIYLPHKSICPWIEDFVNEMKVFPNGKHDDQVDSATQAIEYLDKMGNAGTLKDTNKPAETYSKTFERKKRDRKSRIKVKTF